MLSFDEILNHLEKNTNISRDKLISKIKDKQKSLAGLVSLEGAAHLVSKELGFNLLENSSRSLDIKNIISGMKRVSVIGRIFRVSHVINFKRKDNSDGKVVNIFIGDNFSYIRIPLWNDQVKMIEEETIKLGDVVKISNAYTKENDFGDVEINLGKFGIIEKIDDDNFPSVEKLLAKFFGNKFDRILIKDAIPGNFEIRGTVVNVFNGKFIFNSCKICNRNLVEENARFVCSVHGEVDSIPALVVSCILDDGTGDLRAVFFRENAEKLIQIQASEFKSFDLDRRYKIISDSILGKEIIISGRIKKNTIFGNLEMIVSEIKNINALEESKNLLEKLDLKVVS